jgi:hypothetical protein
MDGRIAAAILGGLAEISVRMDPPREYLGEIIIWKGVELYWWAERERYVSIPD